MNRMKHFHFKRIRCFAAALLGVFSIVLLLGACRSSSGKEGDTTWAEDPGASARTFVIFEENALTCNIVGPANFVSSDFSDAQAALVSAIRKKFGINISAQKDSETAADASVREILIGDTNRSESNIAPASVGANDEWYAVSVVGNKLVINGSNGAMVGEAVECFIQAYLSPASGFAFSVPASLDHHVLLEDYSRNGWRLSAVPAFLGSDRIYYSEAMYACGELLSSSSSKSANMQVVQRTTEAEFLSYLTRLEQFGYQQDYLNAIENNRYACMRNESQAVYVSYTPARETVQVIVDPISVKLSDFSYTVEPTADGSTTYWMYGLKMDPGGYNPSGQEDSYLNTTGYFNGGQLLIIKCADNSVILIDGGLAEQVEAKQLNDFLHTITGTKANEKVTVSCWFITHRHCDHMGGIYELLKAYSDQIDLQRLLLNFPASSSVPFTATDYQQAANVASLIRSKYPNCKELMAHTGQTVQIADVTLQVLYTHEDNVNAVTGKSKISDTNDTSTVVKVMTEGMSLMVLGDMNTATESILTKAFSGVTLASDMVQVAHHGFNYISTLYELINAPIAVFPQAEGGMQKNDFMKQNYAAVVKYSGECYYSGAYSLTVGFSVQNGKITANRI